MLQIDLPSEKRKRHRNEGAVVLRCDWRRHFAHILRCCLHMQGVLPNLFKLAPAAGISWFTFEVRSPGHPDAAPSCNCTLTWRTAAAKQARRCEGRPGACLP